MVGAFALAMAVGLQVPWLRDFFAAEIPGPAVWALVAACLAAGVALLAAVRAVPWIARAEGAAQPEPDP
jgi:hypothetical protein